MGGCYYDDESWNKMMEELQKELDFEEFMDYARMVYPEFNFSINSESPYEKRMKKLAKKPHYKLSFEEKMELKKWRKANGY